MTARLGEAWGLEDRTVQLDLFDRSHVGADPRPAAPPGPDAPAAALRAHFAGTRRLPLDTLQATVRELAATATADTVPLLLSVCVHYGPWESSLGPTPEVQAALAGLARLDAKARRQAAADLARRRPVAELSLPPLLRAEVAATAMPDETPLRALLDDPNAHIREAACRVAGLRGIGRLLEAIRARRHDRAPWVRTAAVLACADLGDGSVRGALEERLESAIRAGTCPTRLLEALSHVANRESAIVLRRIRPSLAPPDQELADEILDELATGAAAKTRGSDRS
jgi:hypothetical protein